MAGNFDPYHRWLGIPKAEQPAHHYRLLGLALFEADPEVIRDAADRQIAHVRTYALGQHQQLSQQILNELAAARACLLHAVRKEEYDKRLRDRIEVAKPKPDPADAKRPATAPTLGLKAGTTPPSSGEVAAALSPAAQSPKKLFQDLVGRTSVGPVARSGDRPQRGRVPGSRKDGGEKAAEKSSSSRSRMLIVGWGAAACVLSALVGIGLAMLPAPDRDRPQEEPTPLAQSESPPTPGPKEQPAQPSTVAGTQPQQEAPPAPTVSKSPPTTAEAPFWADVAPVWNAGDAGRAAAIGASRDRTLQGLTELPWGEVLAARSHSSRSYPRYGQPAPAEPPILPERLILSGELAGIRSYANKTVVYLRPATPNDFGSSRSIPRIFTSSALSQLAAVKMETDQLPLWMADYRWGEMVRVAVKRQNWAVPQYSESTTRLLPAAMQIYLGELRPLAQPAFRPLAWCFLAEGLEKEGLPATWIDGKLGRAMTASNQDQLSQSPSLLCRTAAGRVGTAGRIIARMGPAHKLGDVVVVNLTLPGTAEGDLQCEAQFPQNVVLSEFLDYKPGDEVEAAVAVAGPNPPLPEADATGPRTVDGLTFLPTWSGLRLTCTRLQVRSDPGTLIDAAGPRRKYVRTAAVASDVAYADLPSIQGEQVTWSGKLDRTSHDSEECHLLVKVSDSIVGLSCFEAYSPDKEFYAELLDYVDRRESANNADTVLVTGVVVGPDTAKNRLDSGSPLLKIRSIERADNPASRAVVGIKRPAEAFRAGTMKKGLAAVMKGDPPEGSEVKFAGTFQNFDTFNRIVRVRPEGRDYRTAQVYFPRSDKATFSDYRNNDAVEVVATVAKRSDDHSSDIQLNGKSIVRRANPSSRVTDEGRASPARDYTLEKRDWERNRHDMKARAGVKFLAVGVYDGYTRGTNYLKITISNFFFSSYSEFELTCGVDNKTEQFLDGLGKGDELLFEFSAQGNDSSPVCVASWIAPLGDPENKFTPPSYRVPLSKKPRRR